MILRGYNSIFIPTFLPLSPDLKNEVQKLARKRIK